MNARPLRLESYSREELGYCNALARAPAEIAFGGDWSLTLRRAVAPAADEPRMHLEADWGGARFTLAVDAQLAERYLRHAAPGAEAAELPEALRLAAFEMMRARLEQELRRRNAGASALRLTALRDRPPHAMPRHRFAFALASRTSGETIAGEVATDAFGLSLAAPLLRAAAEDGREKPAPWVDALHVPVHFEAGWTTLAAREVAALSAGDLVLLDEAWLAGGELAVTPAPGLAFRARIEGPRLVVTQPLGAIMSETLAAPPAARASSASAADRIPVRLSFELGERTLTVAELRDLTPGFVFDLGRELRHAVAIRAHGVLIGEGDLVEIDGRLGVSVTSIAPAPAGNEPDEP